MKKIILSSLLVSMALSLSGCTFLDAMSIGKSKSKAEEVGLNYEDTGAVASPYFLYSNRKAINPAAIYPNEKCRTATNEKLLLGEGNDND